eukprot:TRINITY_DN5319_c0_g1_i4.p1 TRINITY_DN5319_c0_g1~~TRINITY_DN5319_c0_g1_i4.p1  ORF type:complete len:289 (+),score=93.93 TRINITY_DN5319_c0_g1_i4:539-1405(+)
MIQMKGAGIGIVCLSWWGRKSDGQLKGDDGFTDKATMLVLNEAAKHGMKIVFHHEPYQGRNAQSTKEDIQYAIKTYGSHPALFRWKEKGNRPLFFVYDPYHTSFQEWSTILDPKGHSTIRGTSDDAIMIGLFVEKYRDEDLIVRGGFDGSYTYFAVGFTYGANMQNWKSLAEWSRKNNKIFIPSVGPGYSDTRIRPWNHNQASRENGKYYDRMWENAIALAKEGDKDVPGMISITSFNEWHEGTQIEPAEPNRVSKDSGFAYEDYSPLEPDYYLKRTKYWADIYLDKI